MAGLLGEVLGGGLDPSQHEPSNDFQPMTPGWYPFEVERTEVVDTKAGNGKILKVMLNVIGEKYNGRKLFAQMNILNPSEQAQDIGRRQLADLSRACGIPLLTDEDQLLGKQGEARVAIKHDDGYDPDNEIKGYRALGAGAAAPAAKPAAAPAAKPAAAPAAKPAAAPAAKPAVGKMPWER